MLGPCLPGVPESQGPAPPRMTRSKRAGWLSIILIRAPPTRAHLVTVWSGAMWGGLRAMGRAASSSSGFLNDF